MNRFILSAFVFFIFNSAFGQKNEQYLQRFLNDSNVKTGHAGVQIIDLNSGKNIVSYQNTKLFLPASNTKLFSMYAGLKFLSDSLNGFRYLNLGDSTLIISPLGDPTLLHKKFDNRKLFSWLQSFKNIKIDMPDDSINPIGLGWIWEDYLSYFMVQRSAMPLYGNVADVKKINGKWSMTPNFLIDNEIRSGAQTPFRSWDNNLFTMIDKKSIDYPGDLEDIPFVMDNQVLLKLLNDTLKNNVQFLTENERRNFSTDNFIWKTYKTQQRDSMLSLMMHVSDNFLAEQTLMMASKEKIGTLKSEKFIKYLLDNDLKSLPQNPVWKDGSGLSSYTLFSPDDFIWLLQKIYNEFGWSTIQKILPTGGEGTLTAYYPNAKGKIYAKTGSMSNNVALSGYLITKSNKTFLFSVLLNNFDGSGRQGRRAMESFLENIRLNN